MSMFIMFLIIYLVVRIYLIPYLTKEYNAQIIDIRDIEMEVYHISNYMDKHNKRSDGVYTIGEYDVRLRGVKDPSKKAILRDKKSYRRCNYFKTITMQEIVYKKDDEIFADIVFADVRDYRRLSEYKINHPEDYVKDEEGNDKLKESYRIEADSYHEYNNAKINLLEILKLVAIIIFLLVAWQNQ